MKFVSMFLMAFAMTTTEAQSLDVVVQAVQEGFPRVMSEVGKAIKSTGIPLRKKNAVGLRDRNGNKY